MVRDIDERNRHDEGTYRSLSGRLALFALILLAGGCCGASRAQLELARAELREAQAREEALEALLRATLAGQAPAVGAAHGDAADPDVAEVSLAEVTERASQKVERLSFEGAFGAEPIVEARLRRTLGRSLVAQGDPRGLEHLARASAICRRELGEQHPLTVEIVAEWQEAKRAQR